MSINRYVRVASEWVLLAALVGSVSGQNLPPRIFYSDLDSGPGTGGLSNNGVFVTIYGKGFGAAQGSSTVTVGGGAAVSYQQWSDTKITFQPGAAGKSGNIIVNTSSGASDTVPFTVRAGNVYLVTTGGSDSNDGTFAAPWKTSLHALGAIAPGDTVYVRTGAGSTQDDGQGWSSCFTLGGNTGTAGNPKAFVAYPGDTVAMGSPTACGFGIRAKGQGENYWTFAGFNLSGQTIGIGPYSETGWRIVGNDITCPNGNGQAGCMDIANGGPYYIWGNNVHHVGTNLSPGAVTALYHGVYLSDAVFNVDFGWNTIAFVQGCRGLQQNANSPTNDAYGLSIHDNIIHDTQCDGIVMTTVDPSKGAIKLYNNIIYNAGTGPNNSDGTGAWSCMNLQTWDTTAGNGSGTIDVYNNTMYACGTFANPPYSGSTGGILWGGPNPNKKLRLQNNIVYMTTAQPYLTNDTPANVTGSHNLWFGNGPAPTNAVITTSLNANPLFVNAAGANFHLQSGSPAATGGIQLADLTDFDGILLPQAGGFPIGAFAIASGAAAGVSVSLSPATLSLDGAQTQLFTATVTGTTNTAVTWSMSPSLGTLSASGLYSAPNIIAALTSVQVTATSVADPTKFATSTISLVPAAISISPLTISLLSLQNQQFAAAVTGTTQTGVVWSMSPSLGLLSGTGLYTAPLLISLLTPVTITATLASDTSKSASATISLLPAAAVNVTVSPLAASLSAGQSQQFGATVTGTSNTAVTWSVSPAVGSISASGLYTAPSSVAAQQNVTIRATSVADGTKSGAATVTLNPTASVTVALSPLTATLGAGQMQQFTATVTGTTRTGVTWTLSPAVGSISSRGLYTAPATVSSQQSVQITAISVADTTKSATATVTLTASGSAAISVSPMTVNLGASQTQTFKASLNGIVDTAVTWSLSPAVGSISSTGLYTAPSSISAQTNVVVKATSTTDGSKFATAAVNLIPAVAITVSPLTATLGASQTRQFTASVTGTTNTAVTWTLSPAVGSISSSGLYTAPASVTAQTNVTVKATSVADGSKSATASVTLTPAVTVSVNPLTATLGASQTQQFTASVAGTTNTAVTWTLSPAVGSISSSGLYTAPASVTAQTSVTVKATSAADGSKSASATVTLTPAVSVTVSPLTASIVAGGTQQFTATVTGTSNTAVTWTLSPAVGKISSTGLYTAPPSLAAQQTVTIKATSAANTTKFGLATLTLTLPPLNGVAPPSGKKQ
jgi:hypothetical protein